MLYGSDSVFVQDNASCHKSRSTLTYLNNKKVCLLANWPPQSPDANIIENLLSMLKAKVQKRYPKSQNELWECKIAWNEIIIYNFRKISLLLFTIILMKMIELSHTDVVER